MLRLSTFLLLTCHLAGQDLLYSVSLDVTGVTPPVTKDAVQRLAPAGSTLPFLPTEAWAVLVGDQNGNGLHDDGPADVDALHVRGGGGLSQWLFSTTTGLTVTGVSLRDGDVFHIDPTGAYVIDYSEDLFAMVTGCGTIDVDGFAEDASGRIWFSFAEDETTSSATLTAQNGGIALLDEQTVFRLDPGAPEAVIAFTKDQVVAVFNQALGLSVTTVVDTTGIALDPTQAGALLLCAGSTSAALQGQVVSTHNGGAPYAPGGNTVDPTAFGLGVAPRLDALAIQVGPNHPVLTVAPTTGSVGAAAAGQVTVFGLTPGSAARLVVSSPPSALGAAWTAAGVGGFTNLYPDPSDPALWQSFQVAEWLIMADATGRADYTFNYGSLLPGTSLVGQVLELGTLVASNPGVIDVLP